MTSAKYIRRSMERSVSEWMGKLEKRIYTRLVISSLITGLWMANIRSSRYLDLSPMWILSFYASLLSSSTSCTSDLKVLFHSHDILMIKLNFYLLQLRNQGYTWSKILGSVNHCQWWAYLLLWQLAPILQGENVSHLLSLL